MMAGPQFAKLPLYQYGNDNLSSREGFIQQVLGFSSDLDEISWKNYSRLSTNGAGRVLWTS